MVRLLRQHLPAQLAAAPTDSWLSNGGSLSNQRFSPLTLLNRSNVAQLKANWRASLNGSGLSPRAGNQAQPIVCGNSIYIMTGEGDAFSVDSDSVLQDVTGYVLRIAAQNPPPQ
jgi:glucose dehydrogenase